MFRRVLDITAVTSVMVLLVATTVNAQAHPSTPEINAIFDEFVEYEDNGPMMFNTVEAREAGVEDDILEIGETFNDISQEKWVNEEGPSTVARAPLVDRWNYCGAGNSGPGAPQNSVDSVCQRHDTCIGDANGDRSAMIACDVAFVATMNNIKGEYGGADRTYIEAAIQVIRAAMACRPVC